MPHHARGAIARAIADQARIALRTQETGVTGRLSPVRRGTCVAGSVVRYYGSGPPMALSAGPISLDDHGVQRRGYC